MTSMIKLSPQSISHQEWLKALILLGLGVYFVVLIFTGNLSNYINLRFAWLSYLAVILFLGLGGWQIASLMRGQVHGIYGSTHLPISWSGIIIVGLPLIFATIFPSQPLGADAISGGVSLQAIGGITSEARLTIAPIDRNVLDWLREFDRVDTIAELEGLPVNIVAFIYREPDLPDTQFMAARFTLSCCVADALAVGMPVEFEDAPIWEDGAWVRIQGTIALSDFRGEATPVIVPSIIEPTDTPDNPYLYS